MFLLGGIAASAQVATPRILVSIPESNKTLLAVSVSMQSNVATIEGAAEVPVQYAPGVLTALLEQNDLGSVGGVVAEREVVVNGGIAAISQYGNSYMITCGIKDVVCFRYTIADEPPKN